MVTCDYDKKVKHIQRVCVYCTAPPEIAVTHAVYTHTVMLTENREVVITTKISFSNYLKNDAHNSQAINRVLTSIFGHRYEIK